jgi:hypothetical protein
MDNLALLTMNVLLLLALEVYALHVLLHLAHSVMEQLAPQTLNANLQLVLIPNACLVTMLYQEATAIPIHALLMETVLQELAYKANAQHVTMQLMDNIVMLLLAMLTLTVSLVLAIKPSVHLAITLFQPLYVMDKFALQTVLVSQTLVIMVYALLVQMPLLLLNVIPLFVLLTQNVLHSHA